MSALAKSAIADARASLIDSSRASRLALVLLTH